MEFVCNLPVNMTAGIAVFLFVSRRYMLHVYREHGLAADILICFHLYFIAEIIVVNDDVGIYIHMVMTMRMRQVF